LRWLDEIPGDHPAMIIAEGVMMYLTEDIVKPLLNRLTDHFPSGQLALMLQSIGSAGSQSDKSVKATGASFGWAIDDPQDIKKLSQDSISSKSSGRKTLWDTPGCRWHCVRSLA